jgi:mono/diheme cytochrome c family protein
MRTRVARIAVLLLLAGCMTSQSRIELAPGLVREASELAGVQEDYAGDIYPFFEEYCFRCHDTDGKKGGVDLESMRDATSIGRDEALWERVHGMLLSGQMPPEDKPQPSEFDREDVAGFVEEELDRAVRAMRPDPGRVTARRLNRQEYDNTLRDLIGLRYTLSQKFPVDDSGYGFDNNGDVLSISPLHMERYWTAADAAVGSVFRNEAATRPKSGREPVERFIFVCDHWKGEHESGCGNTVLRKFATRAYRRPVTSAEVKDLLRLVNLAQKQGDSFEDGVKLAVKAVLVSPKFLYRIEQHGKPNKTNHIERVNDFELASRLSYFLWSSMPDAELFGFAREGRLSDPEILNQQVKRMIADKKSGALIRNFAGQWLELRNLNALRRPRSQWPDFSRDLKNAMSAESYRFFGTVLREDMSILNFLDSDFTFVNEVLANHYGIEGVEGEELRRVTLEGDERGGVLTQASILTLTSFETRTSPVKRGAWVSENILGVVPPEPPDDIPAFKTPEKNEGTIREQFEAHRADPVCASCHSRFDPLGFGLENYDATGRWRTTERDNPVDSTGTLPSGESFEGSAELRAILVSNPDKFVRNFTRKVLTYALGRGVEYFDRPVVAGIEEAVAADDYKFQSLIREIVLSIPFQMRRGEGEHKA